MDNNELKAEIVRLSSLLLDYWGEFGCVEADNGKFREKAFALVEAELREIHPYARIGPQPLIEWVNEHKAEQHG